MSTPQPTDVTEPPESEPALITPHLDQLSQLAIPLTSPIQVTSYLNEHFPTEEALVNGLADFHLSIESADQSLNTELTSLIRSHRHDAVATNTAVTNTNASLKDLQANLITLSKAATDAHTELDIALAPATPVFIALQNVTYTADALDALVNLDDAVIALERAAQSSSLIELASDPSPFKNVAESLALLDNLPNQNASRLRKLPSLRARAISARQSLRATVLMNFKRDSDAVTNASDSSAEAHEVAVTSLQHACTVAEAMGSEIRLEVIGSFVKRRRASFKAAFAMEEDGLVLCDKRFLWLRRELRTHWARLGGERVDRGWGRVFPGDWGVSKRLADGIMTEIRDWVVATLHEGADRDVAVMVSALGKAKEFETELDRRFQIGASTSFVGMISDCFGPWMNAFVQHEDAHLTAVLQDLMREETWVCDGGSILKSATELFLVIKKSMRTCAALDVRQPLFSLHKSFKKHLTAYATTLIRNLSVNPTKSGTREAREKDSEKSLKRCCAIINTGQYCNTTIEQLEESLRTTVQSAYANDIDMGVERERFAAVCAKGIHVIVALMENELDDDLKSLSERNWTTWSSVGDTSQYVTIIGEKLTDMTKNLHEWISSKQHFRFCLEKIAGAFIAQLKRHLYRCESVNGFAAQQILLDLTTVKSVLVGLPASVHAATATTFLKFVQREIAKVEAVLKVILAPMTSCVDTYVALVGEGSAEDLQHILEIRGLKRAESAPLLLDYSKSIGPSQRLKPLSKTGLPGSDLERQRGTSTDAALYARERVESGVDDSRDDGPQSGAVDSVRTLFGRLGSSFIDTGISDRLEQVSSQFESTTGRLKKEAAAASSRWSLFGK